MDGQVLALFLATARGAPMRRVPEARAVTGLGLEGDRHFERLAKRRHSTSAQYPLLPPEPGEALWARKNKRQVLLLDERSLIELRLEAGQLKENVVLRGLPLESLPPGQRLRIGEAVLELTEPCVPCWKLDSLRPGLLAEAYGRRGQLARVLEDGRVRAGDGVRLLDVAPDAPRPIRPRLP